MVNNENETAAIADLSSEITQTTPLIYPASSSAGSDDNVGSVADDDGESCKTAVEGTPKSSFTMQSSGPMPYCYYPQAMMLHHQWMSQQQQQQPQHHQQTAMPPFVFAYPPHQFGQNNSGQQNKDFAVFVPPIHQVATPNAATETSSNNNGNNKQTRQVDEEPAEAAVSRPLSIISLFCWFQIWFSIAAIVLAYRRNSSKSNYKTSIALSVTAIVFGLCASLVLMSFGLALPGLPFSAQIAINEASKQLDKIPQLANNLNLNSNAFKLDY